MQRFAIGITAPGRGNPSVLNRDGFLYPEACTALGFRNRPNSEALAPPDDIGEGEGEEFPGTPQAVEA